MLSSRPASLRCGSAGGSGASSKNRARALVCRAEAPLGAEPKTTTKTTASEKITSSSRPVRVSDDARVNKFMSVRAFSSLRCGAAASWGSCCSRGMRAPPAPHSAALDRLLWRKKMSMRATQGRQEGAGWPGDEQARPTACARRVFLKKRAPAAAAPRCQSAAAPLVLTAASPSIRSRPANKPNRRGCPSCSTSRPPPRRRPRRPPRS